MMCMTIVLHLEYQHENRIPPTFTYSLQSFYLETLGKARFVICVVLVVFNKFWNMKVG